MVSDKLLLVTGSNGMLGTDLCLRLSQSYKIVGFDIKEPLQEIGENFKFLEIDLTDKERLQREIEGLKPDFVIHAAAYTDVDGCELDPERAHLQNSLVSNWIAEVCGGKKIGLLFISTDFVFDGDASKAYDENSSTNPSSVYGQTKLEAENYIKEACQEFYIFRTAWLFGKHGKNFVRTIIQKAKEGQDLKVVDDQRGCPTYTKDLSLALSKFIDLLLGGNITETGIFHLTNSGNCSWYEFAEAIIKEAKAGVGVKPISSQNIKRPAQRPKWSVLNCSKFENIVNYRMRPWQEALSAYMKE